MPISRAMRLLALLASLGFAARAHADPAIEAPDAASLGSVLLLAPASEPGRRMVVTGRLFAPDGATPLAGRRIGVYQTDAKGEYGRDTRRSEWARLHGWLRTDSLGRYEIRTIRPASYPRTSIPEHIHFVIETAGGFDGSTELRFEDDRHVSKGELERSRREGRFGTVRPVTSGRDGVLRVERDLRAR